LPRLSDLSDDFRGYEIEEGPRLSDLSDDFRGYAVHSRDCIGPGS